MLLDLSSAFDTLNHDILALRLNEIGIHGQVYSWFTSFFSLRSSSVKINSSFSTPFISTHGDIPQGSVLGPLLFIIYILPIQSIFRKYPYIHYHLFADDLHIYTFFPFPVTPTQFNCLFLTASQNLLTGFPIIPYHLT